MTGEHWKQERKRIKIHFSRLWNIHGKNRISIEGFVWKGCDSSLQLNFGVRSSTQYMYSMCYQMHPAIQSSFLSLLICFIFSYLCPLMPYSDSQLLKRMNNEIGKSRPHLLLLDWAREWWGIQMDDDSSDGVKGGEQRAKGWSGWQRNRMIVRLNLSLALILHWKLFPLKKMHLLSIESFMPVNPDSLEKSIMIQHKARFKLSSWAFLDCWMRGERERLAPFPVLFPSITIFSQRRWKGWKMSCKNKGQEWETRQH